MSDARGITKRLKDLGSADPSRRRAAAEEPSRGDEGAVDPPIKALQSIRDRLNVHLPENLLHPGHWDRAKIRREGKELSYLLASQVFNRIPGVSAIAALIAGGWVASTFTTSPFKAALGRWGLIKGGKHVVVGSTHQFLSLVLPILVAAITAYVIQKVMKKFREQQMKNNVVNLRATALFSGGPRCSGRRIELPAISDPWSPRLAAHRGPSRRVSPPQDESDPDIRADAEP